jgi:hypothetical protein
MTWTSSLYYSSIHIISPRSVLAFFSSSSNPFTRRDSLFMYRRVFLYLWFILTTHVPCCKDCFAFCPHVNWTCLRRNPVFSLLLQVTVTISMQYLKFIRYYSLTHFLALKSYHCNWSAVFMLSRISLRKTVSRPDTSFGRAKELWVGIHLM